MASRTVVSGLDYAGGVVVTRHISRCQTMAAGHIPLSAGQDLPQLSTVTLFSIPVYLGRQWPGSSPQRRPLPKKRRVRAVAAQIRRRNSGEKHLTDLCLNVKFIMN